MSDSSPGPSAIDRPAKKVADHVRRMRPWQKGLLVLSIGLMAGGVALRMFAAPPAQSPAPVVSAPSAQRPAPGRTLLPDNLALEEEARDSRPAPPAPSRPSARDWSPALFKLGFSFFAGFCIAAALRLFFKAAAAFIGLVLLATFALQYAGLIHINWSDVAQQGEGVLAWLKSQTATFRQFILGQLPSAGSAAAGLFVGWRRN
jgi:uncharacterized membrane protein (Fun14 family)